MAFTEANLGQAKITSASATTLYTVPADTTAIVREFLITNTTASAVTIDIWVDPDGTSATDAEAILKGWSVPANDFLRYRCWIPMATASTIKAQGGTDLAITITVSGATLTLLI